MLITIFGESCTGKSTLADALKERTGAQVYSGKDSSAWPRARAWQKPCSRSS